MPVALGCFPLSGSNMSHFIYLDEAGFSAQEPIAVVGGVVDADRKWKQVETHVHDLVATLIEPPDPLQPTSLSAARASTTAPNTSIGIGGRVKSAWRY